MAWSQEGSLAETGGAHSDACFRCIIPAVTFETASWQLDVAAKTVYSTSSSSDDETLLGSCASKCLFLQELPVWQCHCIQSVLTEIISDNIILCKKAETLSKSIFQTSKSRNWNLAGINKIFLDSHFSSVTPVTVRSSPYPSHIYFWNTRCRTLWISDQLVARPLIRTTQHIKKGTGIHAQSRIQTHNVSHQWPRPSTQTTWPMRLAQTIFTLLIKITYTL